MHYNINNYFFFSNGKLKVLRTFVLAVQKMFMQESFETTSSICLRRFFSQKTYGKFSYRKAILFTTHIIDNFSFTFKIDHYKMSYCQIVCFGWFYIYFSILFMIWNWQYITKRFSFNFPSSWYKTCSSLVLLLIRLLNNDLVTCFLFFVTLFWYGLIFLGIYKNWHTIRLIGRL